MEIQLWKVTEVLSDPVAWAQLCNIFGNLTDREYQNVDIITPKGFNYTPNVDDTILFVEISNGVILALGVLEDSDFGLSTWEILIHKWVATRSNWWAVYDMEAYIKINASGHIVLTTGASSGGTFTPDVTMTIGGWFINVT